MKQILSGFIGTGSMGQPVATNLIARGYPLVVHDLNAAAIAPLIAAGAAAGTSGRDVAARSDIVFLCLPSLEALEAAATGPEGLIHGGRAKLCINLSTAGPTFIKELAGKLAGYGIELLDCPITGGAAGAREGKLSITVSGSSAQYAKVKPMLDCMATDVFHVGEEPGQAQFMKLLNNMLSFAAWVASCEAFVLGAKAGLDPDAMVAVINTGTGRNSATTHKMPNNVLPRTFDYGARMAISYKDISLCLEEAEKLGVPVWLAPVIRQVIGFAVTQDGDQNDISTLIKHYEKWAGVEVIGAAGRK